MKKTLFFLFCAMLLCFQAQGQVMNTALHIADYAIRVDIKTAQKVMKQEGFKKITRRGEFIYYSSKKQNVDAMLIVAGNNVEYMKFLFPTTPSPPRGGRFRAPVRLPFHWWPRS